ncbi:TRAP transporter permease [Meiothermus granaticius]|uniref:Sialic acid TRAP transporter permease protein SiaT n=1 Tax=Meiothermus granaticius NBRC 107808 TaxID=1227551 RepID=A0A399F4W6_9DEIN|nr:TRAP transporter fused permease subunit [Meiothermus granaticius]RIH91248.1 Sialic acid TRAP transporter permease protein SiaT [Meiothermus granaticius NBRC 107808]GEM86521.1 C4-dicarboxylate ABC transporter permease [Meiothermus granaticius NBRC 107808]
METELHETPRRTLLGRLTWWVLLVAALYSLYLVVHPFTPLARLNLTFLDTVQLERATHVFFLVFAGYLLTAQGRPAKRTLGSWVFVALSLPFLYTFWVPNVRGVEIPLLGKLVGTLAWGVAVFPALIPKGRRYTDLLAALLAIAPFAYQLINYEQLVYRAVLPAGWDMVMSFSLIVLVLGLVNRLLGPVMPSLVLIFLAYNLYGHLVPGTFRGAKNGIDLLLGKTYNETEAGIYGLITGVSAKYLVYFTILSGIIGSLGLGRVVANIALALVGRTPQTPGRVTGLASIFMGMFSGSGAADTQFVATLTKPLYEKAGYDRMTSAGLVATSGTIALITPPVLGSIAFIMVEILNIKYAWVIIMALGPCLLYLLAVLTFNEFYARKAKLPPVGADEALGRGYALRYSTIFIPILVIIAMLYLGFQVATAVCLAILIFILVAYLDPTLRPKGFMPIVNGLAEGFRQLIPIGTAIVAANLVFAMMVITGLPSKFSIFLGQVSGESLLLATLVTAVFSLILGMGVPPTATYVLTSSLTAPAIIALAKSNFLGYGLGTEQATLAATLATHMFLFYYAVLADVTPPVALSAYASASVFKTDPIATGVYAARVALSKYIVGFFFLLSFTGTGLLILPVLQSVGGVEGWLIILERFFFTAAAIVFMSAATVGYTRRALARWESWVMGILAVSLFFPYSNLWLGFIPLALCLLFFLRRERQVSPQALG